MKAVDYFLRGVTLVAFIALIVSPEKWGFSLLLFSFAAMGTWGLLYPQGIIGWARTAHHRLDPDDPSLWWISRFIGGAFLVAVIFVTIALKWR
jgi:hypothetical protein